MRSIVLSALVIVVFGFVVSPSRGDTNQPLESTEPPNTNAPAFKDPFVPYSAGPPEALWPYESLTEDEKRVADAALNHDYTAVLDGYAAAVRVRSEQAAIEGAAIKLGFAETLATLGVVP